MAERHGRIAYSGRHRSGAPRPLHAQLLSAEACASLSFRAHSWQQTSTVFPAIVTLIGLAPISSSQAAHVFADMIFLHS